MGDELIAAGDGTGGDETADGPVLAATLALLSLLSIGGGPKLIAPLSHELVSVHGWMTGATLVRLYGFSRLLPGIGGLILLSGLIGWSVSGPGGAFLMPLTLLLPSSFAALAAQRWWSTRVSPMWKAGLVRAMVPVSVGQGVTGGLAILHFAGLGWAGVAIALAAGAARLAGAPTLAVLAGGGAAALLFL